MTIRIWVEFYSYLLRRTVRPVIRFKHVLRDGQLGRFYAVHAAAKLINGYMELRVAARNCDCLRVDWPMVGWGGPAQSDRSGDGTPMGKANTTCRRRGEGKQMEIMLHGALQVVEHEMDPSGKKTQQKAV
ncbi:hypothetical protein B0H14DRAFT_2559423 [Mycena olivaceomarginata]|nr:hypothetical protein B0H14DRAFT_2559423 [Mycena olivaceomarginata]